MTFGPRFNTRIMHAVIMTIHTSQDSAGQATSRSVPMKSAQQRVPHGSGEEAPKPNASPTRAEAMKPETPTCELPIRERARASADWCAIGSHQRRAARVSSSSGRLSMSHRITRSSHQRRRRSTSAVCTI